MTVSRPKPKWNVAKTNPEFVEPLDKAFREVLDPEVGLNILELGLVRDVIVNEKQGHVRMMMTTPFCPYAPALLESTRTKAEEALGVPATIEMGMEMWDLSYMQEGMGADWGLF